MSRDVCEHFTPVDLPCAKCEQTPALRDDIIRMAREAGLHSAVLLHLYGGKESALTDSELDELQAIERFAALVAAAEREVLADWMRQHGFSTGQAYTTESLLDRLGTEMVENTDAAVFAEREECAKVCMAVSSDITLLGTAAECVNAIRARKENT